MKCSHFSGRGRSHAATHFLFLVGCAGSALAADETSSPGAMQVVEVVGVAPQPGLGVDRNLLPYAVQSSGGTSQSYGDNLSELMARNLTGVNINEISGSPFQNDITFRGFRASPVLGTAQGMSVYLDGVRVNEPFGDVINWDMLPEAAISNVLLVPGSNPLYGLNTLGGALAMTTKSGKTNPGFDIDVSLSSAGQRRTDLAYGVRGDNDWHSFIAATWFDDDGWRDHSAGHLGNVFVKLGKTTGATDWNVTLLGGNSKLVGNGLLPSYRWVDGGLADGLYEDDRKAAYTFPDETRNRLRQAAFNLSHQLDANTEVAASLYVRNSRRDTVNGDGNDDYGDYAQDCGGGFDAGGAPLEPDECGYTRDQGAALHTASFNTTSTRQDSRGLSASISGKRASHQWTAGLTYDRSKVSFAQFEQEADFTPERGVVADPDEEREEESSVVGASRTVGLYASDTLTVANGLYLTASARFNRARVSNTLTTEDGPQAPETFTYTKLNPALGLAYDAGGGLTLFGNLSQNTRAPTVIELGCADPEQPCRLPVGLQADPYLKQVVSRTVEAGLRWRPERNSALAVSLYRTVNKDDILFRSAGITQQGYFSNFERTKHQGMDLSASHQMGALTARLSYSYLKATYDAEGELFTGARNVQVGPGSRIAGLPRNTVKLALDWAVSPAWTLGADLQAVSSMLSQGNEDGLREDPEEGQPLQYADWSIRGHGLLTLRTSYRPNAKWEFYARINNVADRRYETYGAVAMDLFPNGRLLQPHDSPEEAGIARFVAPGAPRSVMAGLRYQF